MQQAGNALAIGIRPGAFRATRCKAPGVGFLVAALVDAIDPTEAQGLFNRLLIGNARFSSGLLVIDQPDFLVIAMMWCQPHAPFLSRPGELGFTDFHAYLQALSVRF